jgi:hypothetical protein
MESKNEAIAMKTGSRTEKLDQICLYLRLFLGMGTIWYFELLAFAVSGAPEEIFYLTDTLNMLQAGNLLPLPACFQGVWVFLTFVCKRNVLKVVTRRSDHLYSNFARSLSSE